jgi:threonine dehydrogenase-like Zn-dependent dehydrogenase
MTNPREEHGTPGVDLSRAVWRKSTYSGGNGSCVEIADLGMAVAVRDSKDRGGAVLVFGVGAWRGFIAWQQGA